MQEVIIQQIPCLDTASGNWKILLVSAPSQLNSGFYRTEKPKASHSAIKMLVEHQSVPHRLYWKEKLFIYRRLTVVRTVTPSHALIIVQFKMQSVQCHLSETKHFSPKLCFKFLRINCTSALKMGRKNCCLVKSKVTKREWRWTIKSKGKTWKRSFAQMENKIEQKKLSY